MREGEEDREEEMGGCEKERERGRREKGEDIEANKIKF